MNRKTVATSAAILLTIALTIALILLIITDQHEPDHTIPRRDIGNISMIASPADELLWKTRPSEGYIGGGASVEGGRVYVSTWPSMGESGNLGLFCLDNRTGEVIWRNPIGGMGGASTPALSRSPSQSVSGSGSGDLIFVSSYLGGLYCVNASGGATIWNKTIEEGVEWWAASPLVRGDIVFVNSFSDAKLLAFRINGTELWEIDTPGSTGKYASPAASDGRIFFAGGDPALYCADIKNHSVLWTFNTSGTVITTPAIEDDRVFFATKDRMYAVDTDGNEIWSRDFNGTISSPNVAYGNVYIGSSFAEKKLYCLSAEDGSVVWTKNVDGAILSSPAVDIENEAVYFGVNSGEGTVYALNATDGSVEWTYATGNYIMSPPSVSDGVVFIGSDSGYLYAFGTPERIWKGNVVLLAGGTANVTAGAGMDGCGREYAVGSTTALGALLRAARYGDFNFTINDSDYNRSGALAIDSIAGIRENETSGGYWHCLVNYPYDSKPIVSVNKFDLSADNARFGPLDLVTFYYGDSASLPENSSETIEIIAQTIERKPEAIFVTVGRHEFIEKGTEASNLNIALHSPSDISDLPNAPDLRGYDLIFLEHISGECAEKLKKSIKAADNRGIPIVSIHSAGYDEIFGNVNLTEHPAIEEYWDNYNEANIARLLTYLEVNFCGLIGNIEDPVPIPKSYIYHPAAPKLFFDTGEYLEWYSNRTGSGHRYDPLNLTIGVANWCEAAASQDIGVLVGALEERGANVISIGFTGTGHLLKLYRVNNETIPDTIICTKSFRINYADSKQGIRDLETLNVPVMKAIRLYYMTPEDWRNETSHGVSIMDLGFQVGLPELDGIIDPIVIAGKNSNESEYRPIESQINRTADRAIRWAHLNSTHTRNRDKKVAMIYYNHGGGKDNLGACYVNVPSSLRNILTAMKAAGYNVTVDVPDEKALIDLMVHEGTNIGTWAPGELERMVAAGNATLVPVESYVTWFGELAEERQHEVVERWGEPPGEIMVWTDPETGNKSFVIPMLSFGNVILAPQPTRGWLQNSVVLYHNKDIPPHHQYIAFYLWLGQEVQDGGFDADEIMHFGKHGTQEWLPGKESGLSADDCWPSILIQDIPVIYPYIVDNIGEGTQAKRRGSATMITHLTPPIVVSGLYGNLTNLLETTSFYSAPDVNTTVKDEYKKTIIATCKELYLDEDMEVDLGEISENTTEFDDFVVKLADYLYGLKRDFMPYGLHTFGEPPEGEPRTSLIASMLREGYRQDVASLIGYIGYPDPMQVENESRLDNCTQRLLELTLPNDTNITNDTTSTRDTNNTNTSVDMGVTPVEAQEIVLGRTSENMTAHLSHAITFAGEIAGCTIEIERTIGCFDGDYIPPSEADDPIRNSNVIPTGRNFHSINPRAVPTKEAWTVGKKVADVLIEKYREENGGDYPRKLTIILWAWAMTDQGVIESEILYLVGATPVWDENGAVCDVRLIDGSDLGRPRIDVMVVPSGLHRDLFPGKLKLIDRAIRLAANDTGSESVSIAGSAVGSDAGAGSVAYSNYVRENSRKIYHDLLNRTDHVYSDSDAEYLSMSRIFLEAPGTYGPNLDSIVGATGAWNDSSVIGELFIDRMNYIYGDDVWGIPGEELFRANLAETDGIVHNTNSNLYGFMDNDDVFQYVGGLATAYRSITGDASPEVYITDNRNPDGDPTATTLRSVIRREYRTRYTNPKWIGGMEEEGYAGAREVSKFVYHLEGWQVTVPEVVTDSMWDRAYDIYVDNAYKDEYDLDMDEFFDENNPYAQQSLTGYMAEMIRKEYWTPSDDVKQKIVAEYVESITEHGVTCCHHTCGNPFLDEFVSGVISIPGVVSDETAQEYREIMDEATRPRAKGGSSQSNETAEDGGVGTDATGKPKDRRSELTRAGEYVEGYVMDVEVPESVSNMLSSSGAPLLAIIAVVTILALIGIGLRFKRR